VRALNERAGIGPIISSAMVAAIGTWGWFSKVRDFAAWLGLRPEQHVDRRSARSWGKNSKRGNRYTCAFVRAGGVGSCLISRNLERYGSNPGIEAFQARLHHNGLAARFANTLARIALSVLVSVVEPSRCAR